MQMQTILKEAREAAHLLAVLDTETKNNALAEIAKRLKKNARGILSENRRDVQAAHAAKKPAALIDRLSLSEDRIDSMVKTIQEVIELNDPIGEVFDLTTRPNGLRVGRMRIPLGVIGIIFESRPNVIADAAALCLKSGNAVILRGGTEAMHSNLVIGEVIQEALQKVGLPKAAVSVLKDADRALVGQLLEAKGDVDLLIPRGGEGLIRYVNENTRIPVIFHYKGVCHAYIDEWADLDKAVDIVVNAKVQRPGVCNALETLLVHEECAGEFLPRIEKALTEKKVELRGCQKARAILSDINEASEEDWAAEYLDLILAVKVVENYEEAIAHIQRYGSDHTETIVTENYSTASRFLREVHSSCVLVNASTRFNDGGELGLGSEIGISTSRIHSYGPMGLKELTISKFIGLGTGQVRK